MQQRTAPIFSLLLLTTACLVAQDRTQAATALKGCLFATPSSYQLADDETGTVYGLVGNPQDLRMLVGNDVLVTGHNLEAREDEGARTGDKNIGGGVRSGDDGPAVMARAVKARGEAESEASTANSFRVVTAIKVSDVCVLSSRRPFASLVLPAH
jgi:hypothetical protein